MWNKIKKEYVVIFIIFLSSMILFNYFDQEFNYTGQVYREINKNDITGYGVFDTIGNFFKNLFNKKEVGNIADRCVIYQNAIECFDSPYSCKWSPITRCRSSTSSQDEISCSAYNTLDRGICGSQCVSGCNNNANCVIRSITDSGTGTIRNVCITKNQISTTSTTNPTISSTTTTLQETNFIGAFDSVDCRYGIAGWVADRDNPSDSIEVDIIVDDVYFTTFDTSENERRDVCNELGNSYKTEGNTCKHGFFFNVPDELKDGREHSIDITGPYDSKIISYSRDSSNFIDKKILKCENTELQTSLQNPGLENGLNNWEQHDASRPCAVNAQYFNSGSKSAKCDKEFTGLAQEIKLNTHTDYAYSIFIKNIGTKYGYACLFGKNFFDNTGAAACMGKTKVSPGEWKEVSYRFNSGNKSSTDDLHWELCEGACEQGQDLSGAAFLFDDYNIEEKEEVQNSCSNSCISNDFTLGKCAAPGSVQSMLNRGKTYNEGTCSYKYSELDGPTECGLNNNVCVCYNQDICPSSQCTVDGCTDRLNIVSDPPINVKADEELVYEPIIEGKITGHDLGYELVQGPSGATYITNKLRWTPGEDDAQSRIAFIIAVSDLTDSRNVRQEFSVEVLPGETIGSDLYAPSLESVDYNNDDGDVQLIWKDSGNGVTNDDTQGLIFSGLTHNPVSPKSTDRITFTATTSGTATVSEIKIYVDDSTVKTCSISPCSSSLIGPFGAGAHTYKAVARDPSGNVYNLEVKSFTVTVLSPTTTSTTVHTNITTTSTTIIPNPTSTTVQDLNCSELTPPAPDFCLNGTIVNENDERGCIINIRCDVTTTSTTVEYGGQNFKLGPPINFRVTPLKSYILLEWDDATTYEQSNDLSGNAVNGLKSYITGYVAAPTKGFVDKIFGFFKNIFGKKQVGTTVTEKGVPVIYIIERKTKEQPNFQVLAEINSADSCSNLQCAYQDTNVLNGEYYSYRIKAKANIDDQDVFSNYVEPKDNEGDKNIFTPNEEFTTPPSTGYATTTLGENGQVNQPSGIGGGGSYGGSGGSGGADGNNEQQNELYFVPGEENLGSGTDTEYYGSDEQNKRDKTSKKTATNLDEGSSFIYYIIIGIVVLGITGFFIYKKIKKKKKGAVLQNIGVTNVNPALRDYIINTRKTGYKDDVIKNALINAGWNQQDVDDAFKNLK